MSGDDGGQIEADGLSDRDRSMMGGSPQEVTPQTGYVNEGLSAIEEFLDEIAKSEKERAKIVDGLLDKADREQKSLEKKEPSQFDTAGVVEEAERAVEVAAMKREVTKLPDRPPPEPHESPKLETINFERVIEEIVSRWGTDPDEIRSKIEDEKTEENVFADVAQLMEANILDLLLQNEKFQKDPRTQILKAQVERAFQELTNPKDGKTKRKRGTLERVAEIAIDEKDGAISARTAKKGEIYYTYTSDRAINAKDFVHRYENAVEELLLARQAAKSLADGEPVKLSADFIEEPHLDARVSNLNGYVEAMIESGDRTAEVLADPGYREKIKAKKIKELEESEKDTGDENADEIAEEQLTRAEKINSNILAFFEGVNEREPEWGEEPEE